MGDGTLDGYRTAPGRYDERRAVRFQEVDAAGIVFHARIFEYFHDAYVGFLRDRGVSLEDALRTRSWLAPLSRAEARYLRPLRFGDTVDVVIVDVALSETEYDVGYRIEVDGEVACLGRTRHVNVDPDTMRRTALPAELRGALGDGAG